MCLRHSAPNLLAGDSLEETEVIPQQIHDRPVCHGAAIGGAGRLQHLDDFRLDAVQELVEQPGFADTRIAFEQRDGTLAVDGPAVDPGETP